MVGSFSESSNELCGSVQSCCRGGTSLYLQFRRGLEGQQGNQYRQCPLRRYALAVDETVEPQNAANTQACSDD